MQVSQSILANESNLFGICATLGEDFGFNPIYLRVVLASLLLWNPAVIVGGYAFAGLMVAVSHLLFPNPRRKQAIRKSITA